MPRFKFDVFDDAVLKRVQITRDFEDGGDVAKQTLMVLAEILSQELRLGHPAALTTLVRDEDDRIVYRGLLRIEVDRCNL